MNSFTLTAVGNLARNPEAVAKGDVTFTRFCLVGNDYAGKDDEGTPREVVTTLWFVAFGALADSLVRGARKGDQLFVEARVRSNNWTDKQGEKQYDLDFVVQGFRYGAPGKIKREERRSHRQEGTQRGDERSNGRDHETTVIPAGDVGPANGHGPMGNVSADQVSSGSDPVNAGRSGHGWNTQTNADNSSHGASGSNGGHKSPGVSGNGSERHGEKPAEKAAATPAEKAADKAAEPAETQKNQAAGSTGKAPDKAAEKVPEKSAEKAAEKSAEKATEKPSASRNGRRAAAPPP